MWGWLVYFHPSTPVLNSMTIKKKKWCGSSVASGRFLDSSDLVFSTCRMEPCPSGATTWET